MRCVVPLIFVKIFKRVFVKMHSIKSLNKTGTIRENKWKFKDMKHFFFLPNQKKISNLKVYLPNKSHMNAICK